MALYHLIRSKTNSPVLPLALRATGSLHTASFVTPLTINYHEYDYSPKTPVQYSDHHYYSSVASSAVSKRKSDEKLVRLISSQIKSLKHVQAIPKGFPFQVRYNDGKLELTKEDHDESIKVEIVMSSLNSVVLNGSNNSNETSDCSSHEEEDNDSEDDHDKESRSTDHHDDISNDDQTGSEEEDESAFPMAVRVTKGDGVFLEFDLNASPYNISIINLSIKSDNDCGGPVLHISELASGLKHALHKYLHIRGINTNLVEFFHKYAMKQSRDEELAWLKKLKMFIRT